MQNIYVRLKDNIQASQNIMFDIGVMKTIFAIVQSANYELSENMKSLITHLFSGNISFICILIILIFFFLIIFINIL